MVLSIVELDGDSTIWDEAFTSLPVRKQDVYFSKAYLLLAQRNREGRAMAAVFTDGDGLAVYPFLRRELADLPHLGSAFRGLSDIRTPYGYGGPLVHSPDAARTLGAFRAAFAGWCRSEHVVSEFVRYHPLLETHAGTEPYLEVERVNTTVWRRVDGPPGSEAHDLTSATRRAVRKALKAGLRVAVEDSDAAYGRFAETYRATMVRRHARPVYMYDDAYFSEFRGLLGSSQALVCVWNDDTIVAGALLMRSTEFAHYHLGGSDPGALPMRPNNLLLMGALSWGRDVGASAFHFGGGLHDGDELFRFKAGFSSLRAGFYVGRAIHLPREYELAAAARAAASRIEDARFFPAYRAPMPRDPIDVTDGVQVDPGFEVAGGGQLA